MKQPLKRYSGKPEGYEAWRRGSLKADLMIAMQPPGIIAFKPKNYEVDMEKQVRAHAVISGRVQGVAFRFETQRAADGFGVEGWVRNKRDGTVEAVFEGRQQDVDAMLNWCRQGPRVARVDKVDVNWQDYTGEYKSFDITF